ncbi:MAG: NADH-quinone oxidoreductase subunit C [Magnetococcales bacterium]|nr:NADH-quinone oxidoreductase subunit C [Magnetococcales bacterium]
MSQPRLEALADHLRSLFPADDVTYLEGRAAGGKGDAVVLQRKPEELLAAMTLLRDDHYCDFKLLVDVAGVHYPDRDKPLELVYQLLSVHQNHRVRVKVALSEGEFVPSVNGIWWSADWYEREAYEMFGILFSGHPDLRRLLTEYDFEGFPLRKDFPVTGYHEMRYDETLGRVVREPVQLQLPNRAYYGPKASGKSGTH